MKVEGRQEADEPTQMHADCVLRGRMQWDISLVIRYSVIHLLVVDVLCVLFRDH